MNPVENILAKTGLTQSELARRCGVRKTQVWNWKHQGKIPACNVPAVCRATGMPPHEVSPDFPSPGELLPIRVASLAGRFMNLPPYALAWTPPRYDYRISVHLCSPRAEGAGE